MLPERPPSSLKQKENYISSTESLLVKLSKLQLREKESFTEVSLRKLIFSTTSTPLKSKSSFYIRERFYDVLKEEKYEQGQYVIRQGEQGNKFYIVIEGNLVAEKKEVGDEFPKIVYNYK